jgi:hypothetical protein
VRGDLGASQVEHVGHDVDGGDVETWEGLGEAEGESADRSADVEHLGLGLVEAFRQLG